MNNKYLLGGISAVVVLLMAACTIHNQVSGSMQEKNIRLGNDIKSSSENLIIGEWELVKEIPSVKIYRQPPCYTFSKDGTYTYVADSIKKAGKYSLNKESDWEYYKPHRGKDYMQTVDGQQIPYEHYLRLDERVTPGGILWGDDYKILFEGDKMYLECDHVFHCQYMGWLYQRKKK